jgi:hypothetical protein
VALSEGIGYGVSRGKNPKNRNYFLKMKAIGEIYFFGGLFSLIISRLAFQHFLAKQD